MLACRDCFGFLTFAHSQIIGVKAKVHEFTFKICLLYWCVCVVLWLNDFGGNSQTDAIVKPSHGNSKCRCILGWRNPMVSQHIIGNCCGNTPSIARSSLQWTSRTGHVFWVAVARVWMKDVNQELFEWNVRRCWRKWSWYDWTDTQKHFETPNTCSDLWNVINWGGNKLARVQHDTLTPFLFMFCHRVPVA